MMNRYVFMQFEEKLRNKTMRVLKIKICEMKKFIKKFNTSINVYSFGTVETYFMPVVARL